MGYSRCGWTRPRSSPRGSREDSAENFSNSKAHRPLHWQCDHTRDLSRLNQCELPQPTWGHDVVGNRSRVIGPYPRTHSSPEEREASERPGFLSQFLKAERIFAYILALALEDPMPRIFSGGKHGDVEKFDESNPPPISSLGDVGSLISKFATIGKSGVRQRVTFSDAMLARMSETLATEATTQGHLDERREAAGVLLGQVEPP